MSKVYEININHNIEGGGGQLGGGNATPETTQKKQTTSFNGLTI